MRPKDDEFDLTELTDGDLPADQAETLRRRLEADPEMADELRRYESLDEVLGEIADEPTPEVDWDLQRQTIRAAMEREALLRPMRPVWPGRLFRLGVGVSAAAAVVMAVIGLGWLTPTTATESRLDVAWSAPVAPAGGSLIVATVVPVMSSGADVVVACSEPTIEAIAAAATLSALTPAEPTGVIVIASGAPAGQASAGGGYLFDEL